MEDLDSIPAPLFEVHSTLKLKTKPMELRNIIRPVMRKFVDNEWKYLFMIGFGYVYSFGESELEEVSLKKKRTAPPPNDKLDQPPNDKLDQLLALLGETYELTEWSLPAALTLASEAMPSLDLPEELDVSREGLKRWISGETFPRRTIRKHVWQTLYNLCRTEMENNK